MKRQNWWLGTAALGLIGHGVHGAAVDSGEFTYRGQLKLNAVPVNDTCDFEFSLWDVPTSSTGSHLIGQFITFDGQGGNAAPIDVVNGLFSALLDFGPTAFVDSDRWLEVSVRCPAGAGTYSTLSPRELITGVPYAIRTRGIAVNDDGEVGIGTDTPLAPLHVVGAGRFRGNHLAYFDSRSGLSSDGIAIQLGNLHTNRNNNFITFYNSAQLVTGRIEGFDLENGDWVAPPPTFDVNLSFDPNITYNPNWLDPGSLPTATLAPGTLPALNFTPGTLPTLNFNQGTLPNLNFTPGSLPSLSFSGGTNPSLIFSGGTLPSHTFNPGTLPSLSINFFSGSFSFNTGTLPSATFSTGTLPSATFNSGTLPTASLNPGTLPAANFTPGTLPTLSFSGGTLPTMSFAPGTLPSLSFSGGSLPSLNHHPVTIGVPSLTFDVPTFEDIHDLYCWANENGIHNYVALDPVNVAAEAIKEAVTKICMDEGVTYGSKGADYAEWLPKLNAEDRFQLGQVVGVHGGKVSLKTDGAEHILAVSHAPVVVGNVPPEGDKHKFVTVGFMGQLPVVVRGMVRPGDYIIPSGRADGTAVAVSPTDLQVDHLGKILGRAWSESDNDVYTLINVAIGLPDNAEKVVFDRQLRRIESQARSLDSLTADHVRLQAQLGAMNEQVSVLLGAVKRLEEQVQEVGACGQPTVIGSTIQP